MGRYVFFNTGIEYKFLFGIQKPRDILMFGGQTIEEGGDLFQIWTKNDIDAMRSILNDIEDEYDIEDLNYEKYENTREGTLLLRKDLRGMQNTFLYTIEDYSLFMLGCLIYHQLQYKSPLIARFEV
jgi:hypothetical protein